MPDDDHASLRLIGELIADSGELLVWTTDHQPRPATRRLMDTLGVTIHVTKGRPAMTEPECKRPDCHEPRASQFGKYGGLCQRHADEERAASAGAAKPGVVFVTELRKLVEIGKQVDGALLKARKQRPTTDTRRALTEAVGRFQTAATDANLAAMKTAIAAHERATSRPAAQPVDVATPAQSLARKLRSLAAVVEHEAGL